MITGNVDAQPNWRGQPDTSFRRLLWLVLVSLFLHAPLTPLVLLLGLLGSLAGPTETAPALPPITAIPVDLISDEASGSAEPPPPTEPKSADEDLAVSEPHAPKPKPKPREQPETVDAGAEAVSDAAPPVGADAQVAVSDGGTPGPGRAIGDPVAMSGADKVADVNANVKILIYNERVRNHPLGPRIGRILGTAYQWRDFFGPTSLDPIRDIDRMLIVGPQLRDSSEVIAVLQHNVGEAKMRQAIDVLVQRDPTGGWLDGGVPQASARADRAARVFVLPTKDLVIVTPPSALENVVKQGRHLHLLPPKGPEVMTAYVKTPWRVFIGLPFRVEKSIKWAKLALVPRPDGGAIAYVEAEDESPEAAQRNAEQLEAAARAASEMQLGILGALLGTQKTKFVDEIVFQANGSKIVGHITANAKQVASLLEMASAFAAQLAQRRSPPPAPAPAPTRSAAPDAGQ
jgi:hypothetical protein